MTETLGAANPAPGTPLRTSPPPPQGAEPTGGRVRQWLDRPLAGRQCVLSWLFATIVFVGMIALLGGPSANDASESLNPTWAVAHGDFACAYPPVSSGAGAHALPYYAWGPHVPPLWPLVSGGVAGATGIGHVVAFPSGHALGAGCAKAYAAISAWGHSTRALLPTLHIGYLSWFALLAGVVAVLRASGRGRRRWEALGVVAVALLPVTWMPVLDEFHPQDLLAMGLLLGGIACVERWRWSWAGVLLGLAVASQQFSLLVLAPLFVLAPSTRRWRLAASAACAWILVGLPFFAASGRSAWSAVIFGTGDSTTQGGTVLWESGLQGHAMLLASRILPILVAVVMALWVRRELGDRALAPTTLLSLLAILLSLRVVFEQGLFGYKFMALSVMLVLLCLVRDRHFGETAVWLALASLAWNPIPPSTLLNGRTWGTDAAIALPVVAMAAALAVIAWDAGHHRMRWYLVAGFVVALLAFAHWPPWAVSPLRAPWPKWLWQVLLLPTGIALAAEPLIMAIRSKSRAITHGKLGCHERDGVITIP